MSKGCEKHELHPALNLTFQGCREHGEYVMVSGSAESDGVNPFDLIDGALTVLLDTMMHVIEGHPQIAEAVNYQAQWPWSDQVEQLPDRAKRRLVRTMAHSLLLQRVSSYAYVNEGISAMLEIPYID